MMFTAEIRINGDLICHIQGVNKGCLNGKYRYHYQKYIPEGNQLSCGKVIHKRSDGICELVAKILIEEE
jgi:hypothetical protein